MPDTIYADSGDGVVGGGSNTSWATARGVSTGDTVAAASPTSTFLFGYAANNAGDAFTYYMYRAFLSFDLSAIPSHAVITAATLSIKATGTEYHGGGGTSANNSACLVQGAQASTSTLATSDFSQVGSTELASNRAQYSTLTSAAFFDFTLNAAGLAVLQAAIGLHAKFAIRPGYDLDNVAPASTGYSGAVGNVSEVSGTASDPKLVVSYYVAASDSGSGSDSVSQSPFSTPVSASDTASATDTAATAVQVPFGTAGLTDEFTGSSGGLAAHTSDSAHTWADASNTTNLDGSGNIIAGQSGGVSNSSLALSSYVMADDNLDVSFGAQLATGDIGDFAGLLVRAGAGGTPYLEPYLYHDTGGVYVGLYGSDGVGYVKTLVSTVLGSYTAGTTYTIRLVLAAATATLYINGTQVWTGTTTEARTNRRILTRIGGQASVFDAKITRIAVAATAASTGADSGTGTEGTPVVSDPSNVAKTATDTATGTDTRTQLLAKIDPAANTTGGTRSTYGSLVTLSGVHSHYSWTGFNGFCKCPNGDLLVATPDGVGELTAPYYTTFMRSTDGGATWSNEGAKGWPMSLAQFWLTTLADGRIVCTTSAVYYASGQQYIVGGEGTGATHLVTLISVSSDNGATWPTPTVLDSSRIGTVSGGTGEVGMIGGLVVRSDGTWVAPAEVYYTDTSASVRLYTSTDSGANWTASTIVMNGTTLGFQCSEPVIDTLLDGRWVVAIRVKEVLGDPGSNDALYSMWMSYSSDEGATWTTPHRCFTAAASRAMLIVGPEGDLLVATRRVVSGNSSYTQYRQSWDSGLTWTSPVQIGPGLINVYGQGAVLGAAGTNGNVAFAIGEEAVGGSTGNVYLQKMTAPAGYAVGRGVETGTGSDSASVTVGVGAIAKTASDSATGTDTSTSVTITARKTASDIGTGFDSSGSGSTTIPVTLTITHSTYTVAGTGGRTVTATGNQATVAQISDTSPMPA